MSQAIGSFTQEREAFFHDLISERVWDLGLGKKKHVLKKKADDINTGYNPDIL